jgi:hypothetical protein
MHFLLVLPAVAVCFLLLRLLAHFLTRMRDQLSPGFHASTVGKKVSPFEYMGHTQFRSDMGRQSVDSLDKELYTSRSRMQ